MDQLFAPPRNLTPELEPYRFWIWLQLIVVRMYIRSVKGPGVPFMFKMNRHGDVTLVYIGDTEAEREAALAKQKQQDQFKWEPSRAYREAVGDLEPLTPLFRSPRRRPGFSAAGAARAALDTGLRRHERTWESIPPPDT